MKIPITLICASIIGHLLNAGHAPRHWGCRDELCQGPCPSGTGEGGENKIINKLMSEIALGRYEQWLNPRTLVMEEKGSQSLSMSSLASVSEWQILDPRSYYLCSVLYLYCLFLDPNIKHLKVRPQFPELCPALLPEGRCMDERQRQTGECCPRCIVCSIPYFSKACP